MAVIKSKKSVTMPKIDEIQDEAVKKFGKDLTKVLMETFKNIYDDIVNMNLRGEILPGADEFHRGKFFMLEGTGGSADILYFCIDTGNSGYAWKTMSWT